jgi:hypothetical protein
MGSVIRPSTGQPQIPVEHQTVIIVDKEGVPQAVGGGGDTDVVPVQSGGIGSAFADIPVTGKLRRVIAQNRSGATLFLQFHQKATALTTGNIPLNGQIYQVPNNGQVILGVADFGMNGTQLPSNTRIGLSTTFGTFTAHAGTEVSLFVETI